MRDRRGPAAAAAARSQQRFDGVTVDGADLRDDHAPATRRYPEVGSHGAAARVPRLFRLHLGPRCQSREEHGGGRAEVTVLGALVAGPPAPSVADERFGHRESRDPGQDDRIARQVSRFEGGGEESRGTAVSECARRVAVQREREDVGQRAPYQVDGHETRLAEGGARP
jgi:hypothetical protein